MKIGSNHGDKKKTAGARRAPADLDSQAVKVLSRARSKVFFLRVAVGAVAMDIIRLCPARGHCHYEALVLGQGLSVQLSFRIDWHFCAILIHSLPVVRRNRKSHPCSGRIGRVVGVDSPGRIRSPDWPGFVIIELLPKQ